MKKDFFFEVQTQWEKGMFINAKSHVTKIKGKEDIIISAAGEFKGDRDLYNPEELLLSALSSCHMMSYFYVCGQNGIDIQEYKDNAIGILELKDDSSGGFKEVNLNPVITLKNDDQNELALQLHEKAHQLCFIANSVNFEIEIKPVVNGR
ncbi:OsmC family protein [Nonlabens mediterrranea]|uniref:OsmC family protein n=1 Tax=Nonlabens mediterrranea TaxID=1419947 RepID=A0ABS0A1C9_9FLAO|nr:OsmC family protein [Nonlabens mediterrranea]